MRVVRTPAGEVRIDPTGRANGRGAYLCRDEACWARALDKGALGRALEVPATPELRAMIAAGPGQTTTTTTTTNVNTTMTTTVGGGRLGEE